MQLLSLDLETTGLCEHSCGVIEIGAVLFDPCIDTVESLYNCPKFHIILDCEKAVWENRAKEINSWYFEPRSLYLYPQEDGWNIFYEWLADNTQGRVSLCGANVQGFDRQFIPEYIRDDLLNMRALDLGSLFFSGTIPSLDSLCKAHLGSRCKHRALLDAEDVAKLVVMKLGGDV